MDSVVVKALCCVRFQRKCLSPNFYPDDSDVRGFKKLYLEVQSLLKDPDFQSFDPALCSTLIGEFMLLQQEIIESLSSPSLKEGATQPFLIRRKIPYYELVD